VEQYTNEILKQIISENPGIPIEQESYIYCNNKIPVHQGLKDLEHKPRKSFNSIAIKSNKHNYLCIDFDGYSDADDNVVQKQEKQKTAEILKDNFIKLLENRTSKYRIDETASHKYHVWMKHPDVPNKEFLKLPKFLTSDGSTTVTGIVEVFSKFDKHNVHLAGSTITNGNGETVGEYTNVYAGASFDELDSIPDVKALLISAITSAGYLVKIENPVKSTNTVRYNYLDAEHNGVIKEIHNKGKIYFTYEENGIEVKEHYYVVPKNEFSIEHISSNCEDEFKSITSSIYYYKQEHDDTNADAKATVENQETSKKLIEVYKQYWNNTIGQRHYLMLATYHTLIKYLDFNRDDLYYFYDELAENVDIKLEHRDALINDALKETSDNKYGIPTIIEILECDKQELSFLAEKNGRVQNEIEYMERIKPTITGEILEDEKKFKKIVELQADNHYDGNNTYIQIEPTRSITDLIAQILSAPLLSEKDNIAKLFLALTGVVIGANRTYVIVSGVSSGGKSALVKAVKIAIPDAYISQIDELSDAAFTRYTEEKGEYAYNRMIIDYGDKGNIKGFEKVIDEMGRFQNLITDGYYNYRVTNKENNAPKGTKDLKMVTDGFAQIITTTKDVLAKIDEQLITRSEILYVGNNSKKEICEFNAKFGINNVKQQTNSIAKIIQSHILYNLNKYNDTDAIIVLHWRKYITKLLVENNGVNREIDSTMNALRTYCWIEINRLEQVKGTDDKTYYIPASDIVDEFIRIYGVKSNKQNSIDSALIDVIKKEYESCDGDIDDGFDLNIESSRKKLNIFNYQDIDKLLKKNHDENKDELYDKIDNVSDILRKLEKANVLARLPDTSNRKVLYYMKQQALSINKELKVIPISDDDISDAIEHLRHHEVIADENSDALLFGKNNYKFSGDTDFSFIDQRNNKAPGNVGTDNNNSDGDGGAGNTITSSNCVLPIHEQESTSTLDIVTDNGTDDNGNCEGKTFTSNAQSEPTSTTASAITSDTVTSNELVNLHCHTDESVGDGAVSIEKLIDTAAQHHQKALAITNHGTLNGLYKFNNLCKKKGIKPILGIEAYITSKRYHLILLAKNYQGYQDLLKLHNKNVLYMKENGLKRNDKYVNGGIYYSNLEQDKELCRNLICLSGCISGEIPQLLLSGEYEQAKNLAIQYNTMFNKFYLELQYNGLKEQEKLNELLVELSNDTGIPLTVTGDVHYISNKDDWNAIKYAHRKNSKAPASNNAFMITAPVQLAASTLEIADSISSYDIQTSLHIPRPEHSRNWLKIYCQQRLQELGIDDTDHRIRLKQELSVIKDEIADYHILLYEIVETISSCAGAIGGRGSAVGSLVCYLLGFHEVDPIKYGLLFERFLNVERIQKALASDSIDTSLLPDIDLNIADDKKDEVFAVLESKYEHIAKVMTYSRLKEENKTINTIKQLYPTADVIDLKYNLSVHAGGIILSTEPFSEYLPVTLTKDNEIVSDCSLAEIESRGGIKYDLLGESSSKINEGITLCDDEIPSLVKYTVEHPLGISQFTGYSARKYLKENTVKTFDDLLNATALIRTGSNESWIFQEDMMQEAVKYGITMADADYLRKPRGNEQEKQEKLEKIIQTMQDNGCTNEDAELFRNYHQDYSFNKSHAVAYTLESLKNAKLKKENTAVFFEKKLNHARDPITIAELFDDAIQLGVVIIPPGREYFKLDAKAVGNKLYVGTKFIKGISSKEPVDKHGKFNKIFKEYLSKSYQERLYRIGAYDKKKLPEHPVCLGYKTVKDNVIVATISRNGLNNMWFEKNKYYKPMDIFFKGAIVTDEIIDAYASI